MSVWLHIGSSPSVVETLPRVLAEWEFDTVMTCNAGIRMYPIPDVYVAVDGQSSTYFRDQAKAAQDEGCRLVTLYRKDERARRDRCIEHFDEHLRIADRAPVEFDGQQYTQFRYSGPLCLQYAVLHGATTVVMVGCDGWRSDRDYFDADRDEGLRKRNRDDTFSDSTMQVLAPQFRAIAAGSSHVRFVRYGDPVFQVGNDNWEERA